MTQAFPKLTLKMALSQNLVPSRFREELNVMANNQCSASLAKQEQMEVPKSRGPPPL